MHSPAAADLHLAAELETQFLIMEVLRPHHARLNELIAKAITVIDEGLRSMKTDEADHLTNLRARNETRELITYEEPVRRYYPQTMESHP